MKKTCLLLMSFILFSPSFIHAATANGSGKLVACLNCSRKTPPWYEGQAWKYHVMIPADIESVYPEWLDVSEFAKFAAVVIPNGRFRGKKARPWNDEEIAQVEKYVENGGVLILVNDAPAWVSSRKIEKLRNLLGTDWKRSKRSEKCSYGLQSENFSRPTRKMGSNSFRRTRRRRGSPTQKHSSREMEVKALQKLWRGETVVRSH